MFILHYPIYLLNKLQRAQQWACHICKRIKRVVSKDFISQEPVGTQKSLQKLAKDVIIRELIESPKIIRSNALEAGLQFQLCFFRPSFHSPTLRLKIFQFLPLSLEKIDQTVKREHQGGQYERALHPASSLRCHVTPFIQ